MSLFANLNSSEAVQRVAAPLQSQWESAPGTVIVSGLGALLAAFVTYQYGFTDSVLRSTPFLGQLGFFSARHDFMEKTLKDAQKKQIREKKDPLKGGVYEFNTVGYNVNVLHGEKGRKLFFGDKNLSLYQGYLFLRGGFPTTSKLGARIETDNGKLKERLLYFIRREYITDVLPTIFREISEEFDTWGKRSRIDPFDAIYTFVFKLTCRLLVCNEIADDPKLLKHVRSLYLGIEQGAEDFTTLVNWWPTKQKRESASATKELAEIITNLIAARRREGRRENDPIQYQMDMGDEDSDIIQYTFKILFAGSVNTAAMAAWTWVYLTLHKEQYDLVMNEITTQAHATGAPGTLAEQVTQIQLDAWENEMPALERCIKESIRLVFAIIALRRNIEDPVTIDGKRINTGDFLAYFIHDTHLNDDIYPDAEKWNPDRWIDDQGVNSKKLAYPFLGWGVARFPCTGMRMAKVEMKTIVGSLLATFEFKPLDSKGNPLTQDPPVNRNDWQRFMPAEQLLMDYERRS